MRHPCKQVQKVIPQKRVLSAVHPQGGFQVQEDMFLFGRVQTVLHFEVSRVLAGWGRGCEFPLEIGCLGDTGPFVQLEVGGVLCEALFDTGLLDLLVVVGEDRSGAGEVDELLEVVVADVAVVVVVVVEESH